MQTSLALQREGGLGQFDRQCATEYMDSPRAYLVKCADNSKKWVHGRGLAIESVTT